MTPEEILKKEYVGHQWRAELIKDIIEAFELDWKWEKLITFCIEEYHAYGTEPILDKFEELRGIVEQM